MDKKAPDLVAILPQMPNPLIQQKSVLRSTLDLVSIMDP